MPISGKRCESFSYVTGFEIVPGGGNGSHWKLRKGSNTVIIPNHKELKKGMEHALRKVLEER